MLEGVNTLLHQLSKTCCLRYDCFLDQSSMLLPPPTYKQDVDPGASPYKFDSTSEAVCPLEVNSRTTISVGWLVTL